MRIDGRGRMGEPGTRSRRIRLLFAEDDADIRAIACLALDLAEEFVVCSCASGTEAVAAAPGFIPDLLLLDVMMPGLDGPTTLLRIRELPGLSGVPVVFLTAKAMGSEVSDLCRLDALGIILKPFDAMLLGSQILSLVAAGKGR